MKTLFSLIVATLVLGGCAGKVAPNVPLGSEEPVEVRDQLTAIAAAASDAEGGLTFAPDVLALCPGVTAPHFGSDSPQVRAEWRDTLGAVALCMKTGGLKDKGLVFTGRTDPRGDDAYNMALAARRAEAVKTALATFGVDERRLDSVSRGESDARGTDEPSWAMDRRVDVALR